MEIGQLCRSRRSNPSPSSGSTTRRHWACWIFVANFVGFLPIIWDPSLNTSVTYHLSFLPWRSQLAGMRVSTAYTVIRSRTDESIFVFSEFNPLLCKRCSASHLARLWNSPSLPLSPSLASAGTFLDCHSASVPMWLSGFSLMSSAECKLCSRGLTATRWPLSWKGREDGAEADSLATMRETPRRRRRLLFLGLQTCPASLWCVFEVSARLGEESCTRSSSRPER